MTKRLFSFLLASILMTCTCLSAFAADSQGGAISNTIGNVYNGASDVQSAVSDPVTWYVSNQIVGDSKYSDGIDLICPNGDYEEHYDDAFSSAVCPYDGEALIIKGNGVTFTPGGGSGNLGMGVGRKDLPGYTGGVSNVNRSGVLMLPMEHDFIATTNNSTFEPSTSTSSSYKSVFCPDYKGDYIVANSLGTNIEYSFSCSDDVFSSKMWSSDSSTTFYHGVGVSFKVTAPVDGYYAVYSSPTYSCGGYAPRDNSSYSRKDQKFSWYKGTSGYTSFSRSYYAKGQSIVINARPRIHYKGLWDIGYPSTSSYFYCYGVPILSVEPVDASSSNISNQTKIVINNNNVKNTWNGNVHVDASNHLTYIFPQYTYINENYEHVTSISENPIIYNSETNQYYTYSPTTNNYYYISYGEKTNPTPTPSPDPDSPEPTPKPSTPETAEGGDDNGGKILDVLYKIWDEIKNGFANVKVWSANIQTEISTSFTNFTAKFTEYSNNVKTWFTNLQSSFSTSITNLSNSIKLSIENLNVNIQNYFNKKLPNLPIGDFTIHPDATRRRIIPKMNTNEFEDSHGTWIASGSARYSTSHDYYMAFDGTSNCWEVNNTKPSILQIQIPDPENYFIDGYVLASLQYSSEYPKDWILQGSDDGETWVDLDTQTSQVVCREYKRYDGLQVWCSRRNKFVTQRILILSNVDLCVPYEPLTGLAQVCAISKANEIYDDAHDTLTITIVCMDELSVQMNSRSFKDNINAYFLNTLMCCRHYHISFYGSAQRFQHVDKMLRDVTMHVIQCKKIWRFQLNYYYDGFMLENAQDPSLVKPLRRDCWFVTDADYNAYDTLQVVDNLQKSFDENDMLSEAEILANQAAPAPVGMDAVTPSRKGRRLQKDRTGKR